MTMRPNFYVQNEMKIIRSHYVVQFLHGTKASRIAELFSHVPPDAKLEDLDEDEGYHIFTFKLEQPSPEEA